MTCSELLFFAPKMIVCEANIFTAFGRFSVVTQTRTGHRVRISKTKPQISSKKERKQVKTQKQILSKSSLQPATHFKPSISLCTQSHPAYCSLWPPQKGCVLHIIFLFMISASIAGQCCLGIHIPFLPLYCTSCSLRPWNSPSASSRQANRPHNSRRTGALRWAQAG